MTYKAICLITMDEYSGEGTERNGWVTIKSAGKTMTFHRDNRAVEISAQTCGPYHWPKLGGGEL